MQEKILILDFGSQTTQLIGRRLRELNTYCEIIPYNKVPEDLTGIAGIILSGSPYSVYDKAAFSIDYPPCVDVSLYLVYAMEHKASSTKQEVR